MSKLLGMSFDAAASPLITLLYTREARLERKRPFGWGVAWYATSGLILSDRATSSG